MVLLHEEHLRRFVHTWRVALANSVSLPPTDDPAYASLEALGRHVLSAAGGYMIWMCEMLALPDPGIRSAPNASDIVRDADILHQPDGGCGRDQGAQTTTESTAGLRQRRDALARLGHSNAPELSKAEGRRHWGRLRCQVWHRCFT